MYLIAGTVLNGLLAYLSYKQTGLVWVGTLLSAAMGFAWMKLAHSQPNHSGVFEYSLLWDAAQTLTWYLIPFLITQVVLTPKHVIASAFIVAGCLILKA